MISHGFNPKGSLDLLLEDLEISKFISLLCYKWGHFEVSATFEALCPWGAHTYTISKSFLKIMEWDIGLVVFSTDS